ncbi:MaoC family dehydratase [Aciduricibacillus chroicocephali]|uniref:MaoC family dehydratase n=1 Tax=Aciduricibacillus chroicocephali TaxID=3054939 RepID=A0ABY9KV52_9BACI|nr:MaoC family dehydratase [Bacillaceae bacterium 44XB]
MKYNFVISETDTYSYAELSGDWNPIHFDSDAAKQAGFERPCAHGMLVASRGLAILQEAGLLQEADLSKTDFTFHAPVLVGDEVYMEAERNSDGYKLTFYSERILVIKGNVTI